MPRFTIDRRDGLSRDDTPERIQAWLRANGHPDAEVISTGYNPENGNLRIRVEAAKDPAVAVAAYTPTPTAKEAARTTAVSDGRAAMQEIAQRASRDRTPVERALLGLAATLSAFDETSESAA